MILTGLLVLALISTLFGMLMAVASDVPQLENQQQYRVQKNSYLYDDHWNPIGIFQAPDPEVIDSFKQISPWMRRAIVSVEDRRFWSSPGVDIRGIARAFIADVTGGATQGGSTITEQFVKNALQEQGNRTVLEKLREAALAYHLTRKWSTEKILTQYLNSAYFGNGAYGVESAARVYFGKLHGYDPNAPADGNQSGCGDSPLPSCASQLAPWESALLAGMVANPSAFNPLAFRDAATARRNLVLKDMLEQRYITRTEYYEGIAKPVPSASDLQQPQEPPAAPYFTSWLRPQILAAMGGRGVRQSVAEYRAYYGGLKIRTTLDLKLQQAADQAIAQNLPSGTGEPTASLVSIDNKTGEVRAMVGGPIVSNSAGQLQEDYQQDPFNLATEAERQPGSAFKPFTLAVALESGYGPDSVLLSAPLDVVVPHTGGHEIFHVRNFGNTYSGPISLQAATDVSDNSVYSRLGIQGLGPHGTDRIKSLAEAAGIRTPVSNNYAMILGGLKVGVSPLDMAHAYETFAEGGRKVYNPVLGAPDEGPTGIAEIVCPQVKCRGQHDIKDVPSFARVMPPAIAAEVHTMLEGVVQSGTGTAASISGVVVAGKTGTTTNYADAWFVGWTPQLTTAVWVGFPNKLIPMSTLYNGGPVEGGTFPAVIWHAFMSQALQILASEQPTPTQTSTTSTTSTASNAGSSGSGAAPSTTPAPATTPATGGAGNPPANGNAPATGNGGGTNAGAGGTANGAGGGASGTGAGQGAAGGGAGGTAGGGTGTGAGGTAGGGGSGSGSGSGGSGGAGIGGGG
jgi:penicillin-binding protein 1A